MHSLPLFHRIVGTRVVVIGEGDMASAKRRLIERAGGLCVGERETDHARFAFVALAESDEAESAAGRLKAQGLLVNVADRPDLCDFTLPSVLERGDVLIAVSTGGASAGLAKHLRLRLERLLPASLGRLAAGLSAARDAVRERWPDAAERRHALDAALTEGGELDPLDPDAADQIDRWLTSSADPSNPRIVEIALVSDDPEDLTLRQARWLGAADAIRHDPDVSNAILARARADAIRLGSDDEIAPGARLTVVVRRAPHG